MCKTIKQKVSFKAPPETVYPILAELIGAPPKGTTRIGERFKADGAKGVIVDLAVPERIVQAWRSSDFGEGIFSMAAFVLKETKKGGTELTLTHRGVPKDLIPKVEARWRERCWARIKSELAAQS
ncbi:MAG TPA: SRPBCC domain-containing protein [Bdellovibrionota bacterium]|nr:SRPBCC domain-containing protein [Bdellovibrionota bacterium]